MTAVLALALIAGCGAGDEAEDERPGTSGPGAPSTPPAPAPPSTPTPTPTPPTPPLNCAAPLAAFKRSVWPDLKADCTTCHVQGGIAGGTRFLLQPAASELENFRLLREFSVKLGPLLLAKSVGMPAHMGGRPFESTSSVAYKELAKLVTDIKQPGCNDPMSAAPPPAGQPPAGTPTSSPTDLHPAAGGFWQGVSFGSTSTVLAQASVLLAGRNPADEELKAVQAGGVPELRKVIRSYMQGPAFESLMNDVGETQFLTPGVVVVSEGQGLDGADWPQAGAMLKLEKEGTPRTPLQMRFDTAVRREPVELMKYIIRKDRPYTEMVSAKYTVVNGLLAGQLGARVTGEFKNKEDDAEWQVATLPNNRFGEAREHAGVLSTHAWLQRFPTTGTNRNRHRVNMVFRQFLATDVTALAGRPLDDTATTRVPTVENPNCAACHNVIDPMAAGFQNWSDTNRYRPYGNKNALPPTYLTGRYPKDANNRPYYKGGDNWFRDGAAPGYGATPMPGGFEGNPAALQWLGQQVAGDTRFSMGAVHFFYRGLTGRDVLEMPVDAGGAQHASNLAAYAAQSEEFSAMAARFQADQGHGTFNAKDLMVDLLLSRWLTAARASNVDTARAVQLGETGSTRMLSTAQLNRKLKGLLGSGWAPFDDPYRDLGVVYGEFDGNERVKVARAHTTMQSVVVDRLASLKSCSFVKDDFAKSGANRLLFPLVSAADVPATPGGLAAITANIRHLHKALWREDVPATDVEIQRTLKLYKDIWNDRASAPPKPLDCVYDNNNDPSYTRRAWAAIVAYMVTDPRFLFE